MRVYIETSVISYLTARPSKDSIIAGHQDLTRAWWETKAAELQLCYSAVVWEEACDGDPVAAQQRLDQLKNLTEVPVGHESTVLADKLIRASALPKKALADAMHVAVCAVNGIDVLVTWNCRHIANVHTLDVIEQTCREAGYGPPRICTPVELWGSKNVD
jgi:predicted nucleic acid-binding protein